MPVVIALPAVILALVGLLLIYAFRNIIDALVDAALSHLPVIGGKVAGAVKGGLNVANAIAYNLLADYLLPWANAVAAPVLRFVNFLVSLEHLASDTAATIYHLSAHAIPYALRLVRAYALRLAHAAESYALRLYHLAENAAHAAVVKARYYALGLYHTAVHLANVAVTHARAYALALYHAALTNLHEALHLAHATLSNRISALATTVNNDVARLEKLISASAGVSADYVATQLAKVLGTAETYAAKQAGVIATDIDHDVSAAIAVAWPDVVAGVKGIKGVLGSDLDDIMAALRKVDLSVPGSLAAAIAGLGALAIPALRYMEECGVPNCRNLSQFGRELQNLLNGAESLGMLALFAGLCTDPVDAAHAVVDTVIPLLDDATTAARDLIGV